MTAALAALASAPLAGLAADLRHVPSPDWRDQVVYFAMIDRFDDGDPANDDQGAGEYDPTTNAKYSGGDLAGVARRLDYIQGLGATALWLTPPVANQWWNGHYGGYHGYWATDFMALDKHVGTLAEYQGLAERLHGRGMYLIQDVVLNHTANYFGYEGAWDPGDPAKNFVLMPDSTGSTAPTQWPFSQNDARDPAQRKAAIYHWTPEVRDVGRRDEELTFQLSNLDDLNSENPVVRAALRKSYGYWIREVGVDAFRVDTVFYVPQDAVRDFLVAKDADAPGVLSVARATGRERFHVFGEGFGVDPPGADAQMRKIGTYLRDGKGPVLPGMLHFTLYGTLADVLARGRPSADLAYRIRRSTELYAHPELMATFIDNHDVERFLKAGSEAGLRQALLALMTLPGIPVIYAGTEQGFTEMRASMFAGGYGSGGRDHFDTDAPLYRYVQRTTALRREHRVLSRGVPTVLGASAAGPGGIAWRMTGEGGSALVAMNTADVDVLMDHVATGLPPGTALDGAFAIEGEPKDLAVGRDGTLTLRLPPRSGFVWTAGKRGATAKAGAAGITIDAAPSRAVAADFDIGGRAPASTKLRLVVDGRLSGAPEVEAGADGRWHATVDTAGMVDPAVEHTIVAWDDAASVPTERRTFRVERSWKLLAEADDPAGDDRGPGGRYAYPDSKEYREGHPADIMGVRAFGSGGALKLEVRMPRLVSMWNPPNGFDHVAFTAFVALPGSDGGAAVLPQQNAELPGGMRWDYRLRAHGWSNVLFSAKGASRTSEGTVATPAPDISIDRERGTVTFLLSGRALGGVRSLSGARVYVTTWDYDGGFRPLQPDGGPYAFSGGDGAKDPLVMDDTAVIELR